MPFHVDDHHVGFDTYDMTTQQGTSHHYTRSDDGTVRYAASNFRYIWPAKCGEQPPMTLLDDPQRVGKRLRSPLEDRDGARLNRE